MLLIDKWFSYAARCTPSDRHVKAPHRTLSHHDQPTGARAVMAYAVNAQAFHTLRSEGYRLIADLILFARPNHGMSRALRAPLGLWKR